MFGVAEIVSVVCFGSGFLDCFDFGGCERGFAVI